MSAPSNEWMTPAHILDRARRTMGSIDLDPASSAEAQARVQAGIHYTVCENGLICRWPIGASVWLNPPYVGRIGAGPWVQRLLDHAAMGGRGCLLLNAATETPWAQAAMNAGVVCFPSRRLRFIAPGGKTRGNATRGQMIVGLNVELDRFSEAFHDLGVVMQGTL